MARVPRPVHALCPPLPPALISGSSFGIHESRGLEPTPVVPPGGAAHATTSTLNHCTRDSPRAPGRWWLVLYAALAAGVLGSLWVWPVGPSPLFNVVRPQRDRADPPEAAPQPLIDCRALAGAYFVNVRTPAVMLVSAAVASLWLDITGRRGSWVQKCYGLAIQLTAALQLACVFVSTVGDSLVTIPTPVP